MNKFTIFTVILAVSVVTVMGDLAVRQYFGKTSQASVIDSTNVINTSKQLEKNDPKVVVNLPPIDTQETTTSTNPSAQDPYYVPVPASKITEGFIRQAGLSGTLKEAHFGGKVFQLLDITKYPVAGINLFEMADNGSTIASITEISLQDEIRALQLYVLLQNKTKTYIDLSLNETNAYGDRSFYINHAKKPSEAFLIVKINKVLYAFAYVKSYHPQIKKLIQLLYG